MQYEFHAYGHSNISAKHKTTLEFTKDQEITKKADCIIGVNADFDLNEIKNFINKCKNNEISIKIKAAGKNNEKIEETVLAELNPEFNSETEIVIRKTDFISERTLAIKANKSSFELKRGIIHFLKNKENRITITIQN